MRIQLKNWWFIVVIALFAFLIPMHIGEGFQMDSKRNSQSTLYVAPSQVVLRSIRYVENPEKENKRELLWEKILECESGNSHRNIFGKVKCNGQFGCKGGIGICQLVPSTVDTCEEDLEKEINPFDKEQNLECGRHLFETYGWQRWGTANSWWGSYPCFKDYVKYY